MPSSPFTRRAHGSAVVRLVVVAGALAAMATVFVVSRSGTLDEPWINAALRGLNIVSAVGVGAVTWSLRPQSRLGPVLVVIGFLYAATALQASSDPVVYNAGRLILPLSTLALLYASLAFPSGRVERAGERGVLITVVVLVTAAWTVEALTAPQLPVLSILSRCEGLCPANPFDVADARATTLIALIAQAAAAWAVVGLLTARLRNATAAQRLTLAGVLVLLGLLALAFSAAAVLRAAGADRAAVDVGWVYAPLYVAIPLAFLIGQARGQLFSIAALRRVLAALGPHPDPTQLERRMASALGDPTLRIAYPSPAGGGFLDGSGRPIELPDPATRSFSELRRDGERVATIVYDPSLDDVPGLMPAAGAAAMLALRNAQLSAVVRASVRDLHASRARIATAGDEARRRLQRDVATHAERRLDDVHDALARAALEIDDTDLRGLLGDLAEDADETRASVRTTARGIYPALLAEHGVARALEAQLNGVPNVVVREAAGTGRCPRERESAVYFACLEAAQNALKHAGSDARITISLSPAPGEGLAFAVEDDGLGYDGARVNGGSGLTNIRDRIEAVGGTVSVVSAPQQGTTVSGNV